VDDHWIGCHGDGRWPINVQQGGQHRKSQRFVWWKSHDEEGIEPRFINKY
jgi:hypothetical protein